VEGPGKVVFSGIRSCEGQRRYVRMQFIYFDSPSEDIRGRWTCSGTFVHIQFHKGPVPASSPVYLPGPPIEPVERLIEPSRFQPNVDGAMYVNDLAWQGWGKGTVEGTGNYHQRLFPSHRQAVIPARLLVSRIVACEGGRFYSHYRIVLTHAERYGHRVIARDIGYPCG
jgi:hypothetical protein